MEEKQSEIEPSLQSAILQAAARLFLEKGFHGVGMREIALESGASKALLYYHFQNKAELFYEILRDNVSRVGELAIQAQNQYPTAREQIGAVFSVIASWPIEQRAMIYLAKQEARHLQEEIRFRFMRQYHDLFIGQVQAILREGMKRAELRRIDDGLAVQMLLGMLSPVLSSDWSKSDKISTSLETILDVYFNGIMAE
jgi:AcrR family transcriptional regulator